jgi:hypothetical protein
MAMQMTSVVGASLELGGKQRKRRHCDGEKLNAGRLQLQANAAKAATETSPIHAVAVARTDATIATAAFT